MHFRIMTAALAILAAAPAFAGERDFCADRPGLDTPACTIDKGHLQVELGIADWTLDRQPDARTDTILAGDLSLRYGLGETTEARLGWTAYGHVRERDRMSGMIDSAAHTGDVSVGIKQNLMNPDGKGFSIALVPTATLPVGRTPVGAGDWGAALPVAIDYALTDSLQLEATPEVDAAVDEDGHGRHLAYGSAFGIGAKLSDKISSSLEFSVFRDHDPAGHSTQALANVTAAYQPTKNSQLDIGAIAGLDHAAPDLELYVGISGRF